MFLQIYMFHTLCLIITIKYSLEIIQICPEETQQVGNETIVWPSMIHDSFVTSKPLCIGINLEVEKRYCKKGNWNEKPICGSVQKIPEDISPCPKSFHYLKHEDEDICYTILKSISSDESCPYPNELPAPTLFPMLKHITKDFIWLSAIREDDKYIYLEPNDFYRWPLENVIDVKINYEKPLVNKDCLIYNHDMNGVAVKCTDYYNKVCAYTSVTRSYVCGGTSQEESCAHSNFTLNSNCICLTTRIYESARNHFCQHLAEFHQQYQNKVGQAVMKKQQKCWIGLERYEGKYLWSDSKREVNYTYWSKNSQFTGKYVALSEDGWHLETGSKKCAICEKTLQFGKPKLNLIYSKQDNKMTLQVKFGSEIEKGFIKLFCFVYPGLESIIESIFSKSSTTSALFQIPLFIYGPADYWCEGFRYPDIERVMSNKIFLYDKMKFGNEYVAYLRLYFKKDKNVWESDVHKNFDKIAKKYRESLWFIVNFRKMAVLNVDEVNSFIRYLVHISLPPTLWDKNMEYNILYNTLKFVTNKWKAVVDEFLSSNFCYKETTTFKNITLNWPTTLVNHTALPKELCFKEDGVPISRTCEGNFKYGARWSSVQKICSPNLTTSKSTNDLHELLESNETMNTVLENLTQISENSKEFQQIDIYLIGRLLEKMTKNSDINIKNVTKVVSNLAESNRVILLESQKNFKATDNILQNYDLILTNSENLNQNTCTLIETPKVFTLMTDLKQSNINGLALLQHDKIMTTAVLSSDTDIEKLLEDKHLEAAIFLDSKLMEQIKQTLNSSVYQQLIVTLFTEDFLFNEEKMFERISDSKIIGVVIPEFQEEFVAPVLIYFKLKMSNNFNKTCAHWQLFLNKSSVGKSQWLENSGNIQYTNRSDLVLCEFWHTTHFSLLIVENIEGLNKTPYFHLFEIINTINSILSFVGLCIIFLTAILFKNWRSNTGNQILLNFVVTIALQIALLFVSDYLDNENLKNDICLIVGAFLHYFVISEFCWMFVISILQFKRLVTVFGGRPTHILLKACLFGWLVPLVPVLMLVFLEPSSYIRNVSSICYPSGLGLYLGVLTPVGVILVINIIIYIIIVYDICRTNSICSINSTGDMLYQWKMIVLLFFMLGLSWIFAFLFYLNNNIIFLHLFSVSSTLQGFILFLFFIVFNKSTRNMYLNLFKCDDKRRYH